LKDPAHYLLENTQAKNFLILNHFNSNGLNPMMCGTGLHVKVNIYRKYSVYTVDV